MKPLRINYTMYGTTLTGGVRVIFEIINQLAERGHEMHLTTIGTQDESAWFPLKAKIHAVTPHWADSIIQKYFNVNLVPIHIRRLADAMPECDVNIATFSHTAFAVHRSKKGLPFYHMQHYEKLFYNDTYNSQMARETYFLPLHKIANCIWLRDTLIAEGVPVSPDLPIVNPAIEQKFFHPNYTRTRQAGTEPWVVALGKDVDWKGLRDLFSAMELVQKEIPEAKLVLFGCDSLSFDTKGVRYECVGRKQDTDLAQLYVNADVVVTPSWYESFPLPPIEAMACGTPVVTTRYGTEDYAVDGENAIVVPPKNREVLAQAIIRVLRDKDLQGRLRTNGIITGQRYTWQSTADQIEQSIDQVLSKQPQP